MTPERKLQVLFAAARPPARDLVFEVETGRRVALRRAWLSAVAWIAITLACGALLWLLVPSAEREIRRLGPDLRLWSMSLTLALAAVAAGLRLSARFGSPPSPGARRAFTRRVS